MSGCSPRVLRSLLNTPKVPLKTAPGQAERQGAHTLQCRFLKAARSECRLPDRTRRSTPAEILQILVCCESSHSTEMMAGTSSRRAAAYLQRGWHTRGPGGSPAAHGPGPAWQQLATALQCGAEVVDQDAWARQMLADS